MLKRVLVTGANGYIGAHVVRKLLDMGCEVFASDYLYQYVDSRAVRIEAAPDAADAGELFERMHRPEVCVHLAWRDGFLHNSDAHLSDLSAHYRFLTCLARGGCSYISVMGSMHEVGYWEGAITADTPCAPLSQYGVAKNALRQSMLLFSKMNNVHLRWLRAFYIYGDNLRGSSVFSKLTRAAAEGKKTFPLNSGQNRYDFIHVEELAKQIAVASVQEEADGVMNVCSGIPVPLGEQLTRFIAENGLDISLNYGEYPDRPYDSPGVWGDAACIQEVMRKFGHEQQV